MQSDNARIDRRPGFYDIDINETGLLARQDIELDCLAGFVNRPGCTDPNCIVFVELKIFVEGTFEAVLVTSFDPDLYLGLVRPVAWNS